MSSAEFAHSGNGYEIIGLKIGENVMNNKG